jgi:hypothetical protein
VVSDVGLRLWGVPTCLTLGVRGQSEGGLGLRSASTSLRQAFAICCPFQTCASATPAAASPRRVGGSAAGTGFSLWGSCS